MFPLKKNKTKQKKKKNGGREIPLPKKTISFLVVHNREKVVVIKEFLVSITPPRGS